MCVYGGVAGVLYLSIRMESCDPWLIVHEVNTRAAPWYHAILAGLSTWKSYTRFCSMSETCDPGSKAFTFSQCRLVRTITDQLSCTLFNIRVCMVHDALYVLFLFWSRGKHKAHFLRTVHIARSLRFLISTNSNIERGWNGQNWPGKELALSSVNRGIALGSTCMFEAMF